MSDDDLSDFMFIHFLKEKHGDEFDEIDRSCLFDELFQSPECQRKVLLLYFFLTRNKESQMSVRMQKRFNRGTELIRRMKRASRRRSHSPFPGKHMSSR